MATTTTTTTTASGHTTTTTTTPMEVAPPTDHSRKRKRMLVRLTDLMDDGAAVYSPSRKRQRTRPTYIDTAGYTDESSSSEDEDEEFGVIAEVHGFDMRGGRPMALVEWVGAPRYAQQPYWEWIPYERAADAAPWQLHRHVTRWWAGHIDEAEDQTRFLMRMLAEHTFKLKTGIHPTEAALTATAPDPRLAPPG
jgi:hypothetical protein